MDIVVSFAFTYDAMCNFGVCWQPGSLNPDRRSCSLNAALMLVIIINLSLHFCASNFLPEISGVFKHPKHPLVAALLAS